jgi:hypothetical protein
MRQNKHERRSYEEYLVLHYANAPFIFAPDTDFVAITARKNTPEIVAATSSWMMKHQPHVLGIYYLSKSKSRENVAEHKFNTIKTLGVTRYTDDNKTVLNDLMDMGIDAELWWYNTKRREAIPYERKAK